LLTHFGELVKRLPKAVFIPLGDKPTGALRFLATKGIIDPQRILEGLPHPSGANAERSTYFLGKKDKKALSKKTDPSKLDQARAKLVSSVRLLDEFMGE
jgi:hypothetical protein